MKKFSRQVNSFLFNILKPWVKECWWDDWNVCATIFQFADLLFSLRRTDDLIISFWLSYCCVQYLMMPANIGRACKKRINLYKLHSIGSKRNADWVFCSKSPFKIEHYALFDQAIVLHSEIFAGKATKNTMQNWKGQIGWTGYVFKLSVISKVIRCASAKCVIIIIQNECL